MVMRPIVMGGFASLFFSLSFILNRSMNLTGGSWIWSSSLRFFFMVPFLFFIVFIRGDLKPLIEHMKLNLSTWLKWSTIGFGIFYAPLCFAAGYGPSWLIASTWQITIIAGSLLVPLFYIEIKDGDSIKKVRNKLPIKELIISLIILIGVFVMQVDQMSKIKSKEILLGWLPVIIAAFAYPLGNRKIMELCKEEIDTYQRVLGMTLASLPFWIILSIYGFIYVGVPSNAQINQSLIVAIGSGVIATILFFKATDFTKGDIHKMAIVEATQSGEVLFSLIGELFILNGLFPSSLSLIGIAFVISGMILHSISSKKIGIKTL
jgi:drug/metabolite transporter (DMT)-like permease